MRAGAPVNATTPDVPLPGELAGEAFVAARVHAVHPEYRHWTTPVAFYFRRQGDHWTPVGLVR